MANKFLASIRAKMNLTALLSLISRPFSFISALQQQRQIKTWLRLMNAEQHSLVFQELYKDMDGFQLSRQARSRQDALDYIYGEIQFLPFIALLSLVKPNKDTVFYDLGSGIGKAVIACALVYPVKKSIGIELLSELNVSAMNIAEKLTKNQTNPDLAQKIDFIEGDFLKIDLSDATLIFINSTTIFNPTWEELCLRLDSLPSLTAAITTSKPLLSNKFTLINSTKIEMSWGTVPAYIHERKTNFH